MLDILSSPLGFIIYISALVVAISFHEFAHAFLADRLGDPTPRLQGRLTLNPLAHMDPLGTLMLVLVHFGWGKPVQFDPFNLRNPRRDAAIISLAGPISNLLLATLAAILFRLLSPFQYVVSAHTPFGIAPFSALVVAFLRTLVTFNVVLAIFNLIPIHPLDGFKIVGGILPREQAREWYTLERYGMILLLFLLFPIWGPVAPIQQLISPPINFILTLLLPQTPLI